jgi:hypothetical protein
MPRQTELGPTDEAIVEPIDLHPVDLDESRSDLARYGARPLDAEADLLPGQPIPLFLSPDDEEPQPPAPEAAPRKHPTRRRILQATMLAVAGVAIVLAILSREYPLDLFANAEASLPAQPASPPNATGAPTRDDIAAALRGAYQGLGADPRRAEIRPPDADPAALFRRFQAWGAEHSTQAGPAPR